VGGSTAERPGRLLHHDVIWLRDRAHYRQPAGQRWQLQFLGVCRVEPPPACAPLSRVQQSWWVPRP